MNSWEELKKVNNEQKKAQIGSRIAKEVFKRF